VGRPRDLRDRVEWLLESGCYEEALSTAESQETTQSELCDKARCAAPRPSRRGEKFPLHQIRVLS